MSFSVFQYQILRFTNLGPVLDSASWAVWTRAARISTNEVLQPGTTYVGNLIHVRGERLTVQGSPVHPNIGVVGVHKFIFGGEGRVTTRGDTLMVPSQK